VQPPFDSAVDCTTAFSQGGWSNRRIHRQLRKPTTGGYGGWYTPLHIKAAAPRLRFATTLKRSRNIPVEKEVTTTELFRTTGNITTTSEKILKIVELA
jgi:hypothetical protein